jgi:hypothetical protein
VPGSEYVARYAPEFRNLLVARPGVYSSFFLTISTLAVHRGNGGRDTIRIDSGILNWFSEQVHKRGGGNGQTLPNEALREYIGSQKTDIEKTLRKVIREEPKALREA